MTRLGGFSPYMRAPILPQTMCAEARVAELEESGPESVSFGGLIDDQEQEKRDDRQLATELGAFFNAIDRVVTMMRVYPYGHPLLDELSEHLLARIQPTLDRDGRIIFNIDAQQLTTTTGRTVYSQDLAEKGTYIWYVAYSDGLLQVEIRDGVEVEPLITFLRVIERAARGEIHSDDDTVTMLWEQQFQDISYFAVEGFVDGGVLEDFGERTENEAVDMIVESALDPSGKDADDLTNMFDNLSIAHLDLFTKMQIQANARIVVPELKDADLAYAFAVDTKLIDKLHSEWMAGADLEYRLIEALLAIIRVAPASAGAKRASEMISNVLHQLLDNQQYEQAVRMLELLKDRRELFTGADNDPLGELVEKLSDPMQVDALINLFQRGKHSKAMMGLFRLLGHVQVTKQVLGLLSNPKRQVVALRQLTDLLFDLYDDEVEGLYTLPEFTKQSIYLRRLLSELTHHDYLEWKPAVRLIRKALDDSDATVRELALGVAHPCWDDTSLATSYLQPMANDVDERIRKLALGLLSERHPTLFRASIHDTILARKMGDRSAGELRYLMRLLLQHEGPAELKKLLELRGWFGGDAVEYAKMAAVVLIESGDAESIALIESKIGQFLTAPALKKSFSASLKRLTGARATSGGATSAEELATAEPAADAAQPADEPPKHKAIDPDEGIEFEWDDA